MGRVGRVGPPLVGPASSQTPAPAPSSQDPVFSSGFFTQTFPPQPRCVGLNGPWLCMQKLGVMAVNRPLWDSVSSSEKRKGVGRVPRDYSKSGGAPHIYLTLGVPTQQGPTFWSCEGLR